MHEESNQQSRARETVLTVALVVLVGGSIVFFLNLVSLGIFSYVIGAVAVFAVVGYLHYVLWGYSMARETAGEREQFRRDEGVEEDVERVTRHSVQDLSRRGRRR